MSLQVFLWLHVKVFPQFLGSGAIWIQHTCKRPIKLNDHLNPFSQKHKVSTNVLLKEHWIEPPPLILFNIILTQTEFINCHLSAQIIICFGLLSKQKSGHSACKLHIDLSKGETILMFVIPYMESNLLKITTTNFKEIPLWSTLKSRGIMSFIKICTQRCGFWVHRHVGSTGPESLINIFWNNPSFPFEILCLYENT